MDMIQQVHIGIGIGIGTIHSDHIGIVIGMVVSVEPYLEDKSAITKLMTL